MRASFLRVAGFNHLHTIHPSAVMASMVISGPDGSLCFCWTSAPGLIVRKRTDNATHLQPSTPSSGTKTTSGLLCWHRRHRTPQAPPAERAHNLLPPDPRTGGSPMPPLKSKHLPHAETCVIAEDRQRMHDSMESIWHTVQGSRRSIEDAREAIARADQTLARRLSERPLKRSAGGSDRVG